MTIAVDFDGVIHAYSHGWQDGTIYDPPLPRAIEGLRALMERDAVFIFTTREPEQVMPWLEGYGFDVTIDERCGNCPNGVPTICADCKGSGLLTFWNLRGQLLVTNRKLPAIAYLDDRAVRFNDWESALSALGVKPRLLGCGLCYEEWGEEVHPHPDCPVDVNSAEQRITDAVAVIREWQSNETSTPNEYISRIWRTLQPPASGDSVSVGSQR